MISVALCTYNGERYIEEQLLSILSQSVPVDEIVICDDRSTDRTIDIIAKVQKSFVNTQIRVFINETNMGVTKNFESALEKCQGDVIFLSDQDDVWQHEKVQKILEVFESDDKCLLVFSDASLVDSDGKDLGAGLWDRTKPILKETYTVRDFVGARYVTGATVAIRRELQKCTIPIPKCWIHDAWLAINAATYGHIKHVDEKLICYRQHEKNVIGAKKRSLVEQIKYTKQNINKSIEFKNVMRERFSTFLGSMHNTLSESEQQELIRCINFWQETGELTETKRLHGVRIIVSHLMKKDYSIYNHGIYGVMVDIFILFFCRNDKS